MARRKAKTSTGLQNPKSKINITITPESKSTLETITNQTGLSRSAFFEGILNGSISLSSQTAQQFINLGASSTGKGLEVNISDEQQAEAATASTSGNNEEITVQKEKISTLEKEISHSNELNQSLQKKINDQLATINNLKTELDHTKTEPKISSDDKELTDLINNKEQTIQQLNQEISRLKEDITKSKQKDVVMTRTSGDLEYVTQKQKDTIARLEARIAELQTVASVGSHTLNKWRAKVYH